MEAEATFPRTIHVKYWGQEKPPRLIGWRSPGRSRAAACSESRIRPWTVISPSKSLKKSLHLKSHGCDRVFPRQLKLAFALANFGESHFVPFDRLGWTAHGHRHAPQIQRLIVFQTRLTGLLVDDQQPLGLIQPGKQSVIALRYLQSAHFQSDIGVQGGRIIRAGTPDFVIRLESAEDNSLTH